MKPDKRTCIYYNKDNQKCKNKKCSKVICTTARNCTCYKRIEKTSKEELSSYDENYVTLPLQSGTHEKTNEYISINKTVGTPCHVGYLQGDGQRRHKVRCIYYDKTNKFCKWFMFKCTGSSHCERYEESPKN